MANQLNFPNKITNTIDDRPSRLAAVDTSKFQIGTKQILFGTTENDYVELWLYNSDGSIAGHNSVFPSDPSLNLTTVIDNTGAYEFLDLDLGDFIRAINVDQGRYAIVANFFRNEVGSEDGPQLYVKTISRDRTELRLYPNHVTFDILSQIYEWIVPSVPRLDAQALLSQTFGQPSSSIDILTVDDVNTAMNNIDPTITTRISSINATDNYNTLVNGVFNELYKRTLDNMAADASNLYINEADIETYLDKAISDIISELNDQKQIDSRFEVS